jgi:hypothetical protein
VCPPKVEEKGKKRSFFYCEGDASSVSFHLRGRTSLILKAHTFTTARVVDAFPQTNPHTQIHVPTKLTLVTVPFVYNPPKTHQALYACQSAITYKHYSKKSQSPISQQPNPNSFRRTQHLSNKHHHPFSIIQHRPCTNTPPRPQLIIY